MRNDGLLNEYPLMLYPSLAVRIGLNEAVVLQQVHFLLVKSKHVKKDRKWIYNSIAGWRTVFPFFSESTLKRTFNSLKDKDLLVVDNFNRLKMDKTNWYSINYAKLIEITSQPLDLPEPHEPVDNPEDYVI